MADSIALNARTNNGETPLHLAAESGALQTVWGLLLLGSSTTVQDKNGKTPYETAIQNKNYVIADIIKNHGKYI